MKATNSMISKAVKDGATVTNKPKVQKPKPKTEPPPPPTVDLEALSGPIRELVESLQAQAIVAQEQLQASQQQNTELQAMVQAVMAEKPMRLRPHRDMDPHSKTYLLTEYIDVIPVDYQRKLDS